MKLLTKTSLFFLTIALALLFLGGIGFYFAFKHIANQDVETELKINLKHLVSELSNKRNTCENKHDLLQQVCYKVDTIPQITDANYRVKDSLIFDSILNKYQEYKMMSLQSKIKDRAYQFTVSKSLNISDGLVEKLAVCILFLSIIFLICFNLFNRYFLSRIWSSFFQTIKTIQTYDLNSSSPIEFTETEIYEFELLNNVLRKMVERIKLDFINLKEFNENISHEIQTPLAIIKTKIDLLLQSDKLQDQQIGLIQSIYTSTSRLSNLSKSLNLLAKIDNKQFQTTEQVDVNALVKFHLSNFEEIIAEKKIKINEHYGSELIIVADSNLANIMVLNLLKNAIRHNCQGGVVDIKIESDKITICNSSLDETIEAEALFKRFSKRSGKTDSLGLGLSIVKRICDYYHFEIRFSSQNAYVTVFISFLNKH